MWGMMEPKAKAEALRRLRTIEGHIRGVQRMLEEESSCLETIRQTLAVRRALDRVSQLLVSSQVRGCLAVGTECADAQERERIVQELLDALELTDRL